MNPDLLLTHSLRALQQGAAITRVLAAALDAVEPAQAVRRFVRRNGTILAIGEQTFDLSTINRVFIVAYGKAAAPMARAAAEVVGEYITQGVVVVKEGHIEGGLQEGAGLPATLALIESGHPIPDERGVDAAQQIATMLEQTSEHDLVIALLSGGGSALLTLPVEDVSLADLQQLTQALLACGASINEINALRKHLDRIKGGGLAALAFPARLATLILSDVVGSPLDVIASGPTVPDPSTFADAYAVLERYQIAEHIPHSIRTYLQQGLEGQRPETLKANDPRLAQVLNLLVGSNPQAAGAALEAAKAEGFQTLLLTTYLQAEAREAGRFLASIAREIATTGQPLKRPACIVAGGETIVTLRGNGRGGRNQELALAAVADLAGLENIVLVALATDGGDGPTDAAGAVVLGSTLERARELGLNPLAYLARNDAYPFFEALGDLLRPGPTQTNVNDLVFVFAL